MSAPLTGLIAAPHTPLRRDGNVDLSKVELQADHLLDSGVSGVFVAGTTGECSSLTMPERFALARRWCEVGARSDLRVVIHVGRESQDEALELARDARRCGAHAIAALAPAYFKPASVDDLAQFLAPIAAAAPDLPFYYYHIPSMTGVNLPMAELLCAAGPRIPNLRGLKYSDPNLAQLQHCLQIDDGAFDILFGCDEILLAAWTLGVRGAVGSTYNFAAPLYHRMIAAFDAGDLEAARLAQAQAAEMIRLIRECQFLPASKDVMSRYAVECGPVRSPLSNLSDPQRESLFAKLDALGAIDAPQRVAAVPR